jgi:hypothetical protein
MEYAFTGNAATIFGFINNAKNVYVGRRPKNAIARERSC